MGDDVVRETWEIGRFETDEIHVVEVEIDMSWLVKQVGNRAIVNRTGRAVAMAGAVTVKHLGRKKVRPCPPRHSVPKKGPTDAQA